MLAFDRIEYYFYPTNIHLMPLSPLCATPERKWHIYKITSPSNRVYIGRTCNIVSRIRNYKSLPSSKGQRQIHKSIKKYGWDAHSFEVIDSFFSSDIDVVDSKEMFWIRSYMSHYTKYPEMKGLNLTSGGSGTLGIKFTEERKKACSERLMGKPTYITEEGRKTLSEKLKKRLQDFHPFKGLKHTEEWKMAMSAKMKGKQKSESAKKNMRAANLKTRGRAIYQLDKDGNILNEYSATSIAAEQLGLKHYSIGFVLQGRIKQTSGHYFKYKID